MKNIIEKIGEYEFNIPTRTNAEGALLWDEAVEQKYNQWLEEVYCKNKELFTVQKIAIPQVVMDIIDGILASNPGCDRSNVVLAMVRVYLDRVDGDETLRQRVEGFYNKKPYQEQLGNQSGVEKIKIRFMPTGYVEIKAYANLFDLKPKEVVENMVYRIAACFSEEKEIARATNSYLAA